MERTNKEHLAVIDETVKYYSEDPSRRSLEGGEYGCSYYHKNKTTGLETMCAVGRCLVNPKDKDAALVEFENQGQCSGTGVKALLTRFNQRIFKPEYRGFDTTMWESLQELHDGGENWNKEGLTEYGKAKVKRIKELYEA